MDIQAFEMFLMWCTITNGSILVLWTMIFICAPNFVYRTHHQWFPISRDTFNVVIYSFLGVFKIFFLMFNVVPYVALLLVTR